MNYSSFANAKIAHPDRDVFTNTANDKFQSKSDESFFIRCLPSHHCMTVDKFLYDGHEFVEGDVYLNSDGRTLGVVNIPDYNNKRSTIDCDLYILRAAALEAKEPKRTKESYEKVEFIKLSDAALAVDAGNIQFNKFGNQPIDDKALALHYYNNGSLSFYRRIETPVEWWEDASEFINQTDDDNCSSIMEGKLHVNATLTQDQWCDFARILLEQGE